MPDDLPANWGRFAPLVRRALVAGEGSYNERDVLFALLSGQTQLFVAGEPPLAVCIVEVAEFPRQRKLMVRWVAGDGDLMMNALGELKELARRLNCQKIEAYGRRGWLRKLCDWNCVYVVLQMDV